MSIGEMILGDLWNDEFRKGKYDGEPPIAFVDRIKNELGEDGRHLFGLYPGFGNGRNLVPLLEDGYDIRGMDVSEVAIEQTLKRHPDAVNRIWHSDFAELNSTGVFHYIVAIQVFQHGDIEQVNRYFASAAQALQQQGKLFLRVNSASTEPYFTHHRTEDTEGGGVTIVYDDGSKTGESIHFYSDAELRLLAQCHGFEITGEQTEVVEERPEPQTGTYTQWEGVWQKI